MTPPYGTEGSSSPAYPGGAAELSQDDKTMAMLAYILGIFFTWVPPLVIWLIKKDQSKFVAFHALQALILHGVIFVGYIVGSVLAAVTFGLGGLLNLAIWIAGIVFSIMAGMAANRGEWYEMPVIGAYAKQYAGL